MRLCLMIEGQEGVTWPQWVAIAQTCEAHGIETLMRSDHYLNLGDHPERGSLDALGTVCGLAAVTSTLRLGTMVSPATFRHPSELAKLATTADHISGGRFELGLGAGWNEREHAAYGFPFGDLRTRMDVLEEQLAIVVGSWDETPFDFSGAHYTLAALNAQPKPVRRPDGGRIPLIMGGAAGPRSTRMAARYADEYNTVSPTPDEARERRERLHAACERAGRAPLPFSVMTTVLVGADAAELADRAALLEERAGYERGSLLREPPAGTIVGTLEQAAERIGELARSGVDRIMCQHLLHDDLDAIALLGDRLAPAVA